MTTTNTDTKWQAAEGLGPRQAKAFNEALSKFSWEAKAITEIMDSGEFSVTPLMGTWNPKATELMAEIKERYGCQVTPANYQALVADLAAATSIVRDNRPKIDKRTSPEERAERARIRAEREAKEKAEAEHLATLTRHNYGLAETAATIKRVLGVLWPGTKFSVRSERYSGGNSIDASWTDGPTGKQVNDVLGIFERAWFDGMEDLEHHIDAIEWNGHLFDFSGKYIRGQRDHSHAFLAQIAERFATETGTPAPEIIDSETYSYFKHNDAPCGYSFFGPDEESPNGTICSDPTGHWDAAQICREIASHTAAETARFGIDRDTVLRIVLGEIGAPEKAEATTGAVTGVTVTLNDEKNGVEIRFPSKPDTAVLERLKANGWRWSRFSNCWYAKQSPSTLAFAESLKGGE